MTPRPAFNPLPACPNPIKWDVEGRIAELQAMIDSPETKEGQKINLQAAINLYHEKKLPALAVHIQKGKVISIQELDTAYPFWVEVTLPIDILSLLYNLLTRVLSRGTANSFKHRLLSLPLSQLHLLHHPEAVSETPVTACQSRDVRSLPIIARDKAPG